MTLKTLIKELQMIYDESKGSGHIKEGEEPKVRVYLETSDDIEEIEITSIEPDRYNCGCWVGATLHLNFEDHKFNKKEDK
jgi:hypothetical protein